MASPRWERFAEPWHTTALRTGLLALAIGVGVAAYRRQPALIPVVTLIALWFTLGGHFADLWFRNRLRQHVSGHPVAQASARIGYWFVAGLALYAGILATKAVLGSPRAVLLPWWVGGLAFVGVELVIHLLLRARGAPSFYDGRG